jgi:hypothetical protein
MGHSDDCDILDRRVQDKHHAPAWWPHKRFDESSIEGAFLYGT